MKKATVLFCLMLMFLMIIPLKVEAVEMKQISSVPNSTYGALRVMESATWETKPNGDKYIRQEYYITKVNPSGYVYIELLESSNVKITSAVAESNFEMVGDAITTTTGKAYIFKLKNGNTLSSETKLLTAFADIVDPNDKSCNLSYSLKTTNCESSNGKYFDKNGALVDEAAYKESCEGGTVTPTEPTDEPGDVPNDTPTEDPTEPEVPDSPQTGSVIPYVAIAGGLVAIAGVYLYSKKANKMYKL